MPKTTQTAQRSTGGNTPRRALGSKPEADVPITKSANPRPSPYPQSTRASRHYSKLSPQPIADDSSEPWAGSSTNQEICCASPTERDTHEVLICSFTVRCSWLNLSIIFRLTALCAVTGHKSSYSVTYVHALFVANILEPCPIPLTSPPMISYAWPAMLTS